MICKESIFFLRNLYFRWTYLERIGFSLVNPLVPKSLPECLHVGWLFSISTCANPQVLVVRILPFFWKLVGWSWRSGWLNFDVPIAIWGWRAGECGATIFWHNIFQNICRIQFNECKMIKVDRDFMCNVSIIIQKIIEKKNE